MGAGCDEGAAALPGDNQAALAQDLHRVPDGLVSDSEICGKLALGRQPAGDRAAGDARSHGVRDLAVGGLPSGSIVNMRIRLAQLKHCLR
jgi:hypothetical protein